MKPLGSEKLQGMDKIRRILEIARYNEAPKQEINELSTTNYTIRLADGNTYGIVKEKSGYIIKKGLNESILDYSEHLKHRKYYRSYSEALKRLNLMASEINRIHEHVTETPLIGEQKFVLKTKKKSKPVDAGAPPSDAGAPPSPPTDAGAGTPPTDAGTPPADSSTPPPPPADTGTPPTDAGAPPMDSGAPPTDAGAPPMEEPMGGMEEPMGGMEEPMGGMEEPMGGMEEPMGGMEDEDEEGSTGALKSIQKLTGKLGQKLRSYDKDKGMDSQDIKYVINSILSAIDLENLDEDDKDDILAKFDETEESYGEEGPGELDLGSDEDMDMGMDMDMGGSPTPPQDASMAEPKENYQSIMDSIFTESKVESVLKNYFDIKPSEKVLMEEKRKKSYLKNKLSKIEQKKELKKLSETYEQYLNGEFLLKENHNSTFIGKTNKKNLIFSINGKQVKVTPQGDII